MAIELVTKFLPYVDEIFKAESKRALLTNNNFDWTGAHTVKVYKVSTAQMNDYGRNVKLGSDGLQTVVYSRYGSVEDLDATVEELTLKKDRSFTFVIDKLDQDETAQQLQAASALSRQQREVVIPEIDKYVYGVMTEGAGTKPAAVKLTATNIYTEILKASNALDNAEIPEDNRVILVTPDTYVLMKQCKDIVMETNIGNDMRLKGVVSNLDGALVVKVPAVRLPAGVGFMMAHPSATVAPVKLEDYKMHSNPPGISGALVEGRICYDAFVLDNKKLGIYYQANSAS